MANDYRNILFLYVNKPNFRIHGTQLHEEMSTSQNEFSRFPNETNESVKENSQGNNLFANPQLFSASVLRRAVPEAILDDSLGRNGTTELYVLLSSAENNGKT